MVKILWVDDEIELLKPHVLFLKQKGYEVDTCNNGYDAIDMASEEAYDLIILDEMMPGMTDSRRSPRSRRSAPQPRSSWSPRARRRTSWTRPSARRSPTTSSSR